MVDPSGLEPESQAPQACALSIGRRIENPGADMRTRTPITGSEDQRLIHLDDTRITWLDRGDSNSYMYVDTGIRQCTSAVFTAHLWTVMYAGRPKMDDDKLH